LVGLNKAREMLLLGSRYEAAERKKIGVAWRVVSDDRLMDDALEIATQLSRLPPLSVRAMKRVLNQCAVGDLQRALQLETEATIAGFLDPETTERLKDF
jgi:enoyl-CoA hydratase/carnithine racemase